MSKIFISHASQDDAQALAIGIWLNRNGWDDYFVDLHLEKGIAPGQRWQDELRAAGERCEVVVVLLSRAWSASDYCRAECIAAQLLRKKILAARLDDVSLDTLPGILMAEWQICNLFAGEVRDDILVPGDQRVRETTVSFPEAGLARLKEGLRRANVDPLSFPWPPDGAWRSPYPGFKPLQAEDVAVFFGRDAAIAHGLGVLHDMRSKNVEHLVVVLGASGAGKSSFLRAGLWPRLKRDDRNFAVLPTILPGEAVLNGGTGLAESFATAFKELKAAKALAGIRAELATEQGFARLLAEIRSLHLARLRPGSRAPAIVLCIDQGEELFQGAGGEEEVRFLNYLAWLLGPQAVGHDSPSRLHVIPVIAIPTRNYEAMQKAEALKRISQTVISLPAMDRSEYKAVIEGPAARSTAANYPLVVEPQLTLRLLRDAQGTDALPLLAFTLERLFLEYGGSGRLSDAGYEELGGIRGAIEAAIAAARAEPHRPPAIPSDRDECERLLRAAFIPWLARVDRQTDKPRRRLARWSEIPEPSRAIVERMVSVRLLLRDHRAIDGSGQKVDVVEVSHEALLRQWPSLTSWLEEEAGALRLADEVLQAAEEWRRRGSESPQSWLVHIKDRFTEADALRRRPDFEKLLGEAGADYLKACEEREIKALAQDQERIRIEQEKTGRLQRLAGGSMIVIALILTFVGVGIAHQKRLVSLETSSQLSAAAAAATENGFFDRAMRFAVASRDKGLLSPGAPDADAQLRRAANESMLVAQLGGHLDTVESVMFSRTGDRVLTASIDRSVRVWEAGTGRHIALIKHGKEVRAHRPEDGSRRVLSGRESMMDTSRIRSAALSPDGRRVLTAGEDGTVRLWDANNGKEMSGPGGGGAGWNFAAFDPDGLRVVAVQGGKPARIWDSVTNKTLALDPQTATTQYAAFSPDGKLVLTAQPNIPRGKLWISDAATGQTISRMESGDEGLVAAMFSGDSKRIVTRSDHGRVGFVYDVESGNLLSALTGHEDVLTAAAFLPDGIRVATASKDKTVRLWNSDTGKETGAPRVHAAPILSLAIDRDGERVITGDDTGLVLLEEVESGKPVARLEGHGKAVQDVEFDASGRRIASASADYTARVWDVTPGKTIPLTLRGAKSGTGAAMFSADGRRAIATSVSSNILVWDIPSGKLVAEIPDSRGDAAFSPDGVSVTLVSNGTATLWDTSKWMRIARYPSAMPSAGDLRLSGDGRRVAVFGLYGSTSVFDVSAQKEALQLSSFVGAISPDGKRMLVTDDNGNAEVLDTANGKRIAQLEEPDEEGHVYLSSVSFSSDGARVVALIQSRTQAVSVWDSSTGRAIAWFKPPDPHYFNRALLSPDGRRVLTWGDRRYTQEPATLAAEVGPTQLWDADNGREIATLKPSVAPVYGAVFSREGRYLVTRAGTNVSLWDARSGQRLTELAGVKREILSVALSPDNRFILTAEDEAVRVWPIGWLTEDADVFARVCATKLHGAKLLTKGDVESVWPLRRQQGANVCDSIERVE